MAKKKYYLFTFFCILLYYCFNNFHTSSTLYGTYINVNFENSPISPRVKDTLRILKHNDFYSNYLRSGKYEIFYISGGTKIRFKGTNSLVGHVSRTWIGTLKIIVFPDSDHYFRKINSTPMLSNKMLKRLRVEDAKSKIEEAKVLESIKMHSDSIHPK